MKNRNQFILFLIAFCFALLTTAPASSEEIEYDAKTAQQIQVFKLITWQTTMCMNEGAMNLLRMGQRDVGEMAAFLSKTCGVQFYKFSTIQLNISPDRTTRLLLAMAVDEIKRAPGVSMKK